MSVLVVTGAADTATPGGSPNRTAPTYATRSATPTVIRPSANTSLIMDAAL
jgi:hypothetical protein